MTSVTEVSFFTYIIIVLASYRLTRLLVIDVIFEPLREKVWNKFPPSTKLGYVFTCMWCMSIWASLALILLFLVLPLLAYVVSLVLSISAIVGVIAARLD
jgi:hypothetical protein